MIFLYRISVYCCRATITVEKAKKANISRYIPTLSIFAEWISLHTKYLQATNNNEIPNEFQHILSNIELIRIEKRARSNMRSSISILKDYIENNIQKFESNSLFSMNSVEDACKLPLKEHLLFCGFLPLQDHIEVSF